MSDPTAPSQSPTQPATQPPTQAPTRASIVMVVLLVFGIGLYAATIGSIADLGSSDAAGRALGEAFGVIFGFCTGTLVYALRAKKLRYGVASLCIGGGMGIAIAVEALNA